MSSAGDYYVGGKTTDTSLVSHANSATYIPFLAKFSTNGGTLQWAMQYYGSKGEITALKFMQDGYRLYLIQGNGVDNFVIGRIDPSNGDYRIMYDASSSALVTQAGLYLDSSAILYIAMQYQDKFTVKKYTYSNALNDQWEYWQVSSSYTQSRAITITPHSTTTYIIATGYIYDGTNYYLMNAFLYTATGSLYGAVGINLGTNLGYFSEMEHQNDGTYDYMYYCFQTSPKSNTLRFAIITQTLATVVSSSAATYTKTGATLECIGIYVTTNTYTYLNTLIFDSSTGDIYYAYVYPSSLGMTLYTLPLLSSSQNVLKGVHFTGAWEFYYINQVKYINSATPKSYSYYIGSITAWDTNQICQTVSQTNTWETFTTFIPTWETLTPTFASSSFSYSSTVYSETTLTNKAQIGLNEACIDYTLTAATASPTSYSYTIHDSGATYYLLQQTIIDTSPSCVDDTYTYTLTYQDGTAVPSFLAITYNSPWWYDYYNYYYPGWFVYFTITTTDDVSYEGEHQLQITGTLAQDTSKSIGYTFTLYVRKCTLTASTISSLTTYTVNSAATDITYSAFTQEYCLSSTITYSSTLSDSSALPSFITHDTGSSKFTVYTTDRDDSNSYTIYLYGSVTISSTYTYTAQTSFNVIIQPDNTEGPSFSSNLKDQELDAGTKLTYKLPSITDPDGDQYKVSAALGTAFSWTTFSSLTFKISPGLTISGTFPVTVTLTDKNPNPLTNTYTFDIIVKAAETENEEIPASTSNSSNSTNSTFEGVVIGDDSVNSKNNAKKQFIMDSISLSLTAKITSISQLGVVTVSFSEQLIIPSNYSNYSYFNDSILQIKIKPGEGQDPKNLNFTWNCTGFTEKKMTLQLNFGSPSMISLEKSTKTAIKQGTTLSKAIPQQISAASTAMMAAIGDKASASLKTVMMGNFAINLILYDLLLFIKYSRSASLQYLWGMINVLQIIVHMPLFSVTFPANAQFLYSMIISITQFDILPSGTLGDTLFDFGNDDEAVNEDFDELDIFKKEHFLFVGQLIYVTLVR